MKIKNFKNPLMCIVFSTTLLIASTFTSCQKDESIAPSGSDTSSTNKGNNIGVVIHSKPDSTTVGGTTGTTGGGTKTGTTGGTTTGTTGGGTKTGTTGGTTGTTGGGTKTGTTGGTTGTTGGGTKTGTTGGTTTGTTGGGTKTGTTGGTTIGTTGGGTKTGTTGGTTTGTTTGGGTKTGTTGGATTGTTTGGGTKTGTGGTTTGTTTGGGTKTGTGGTTTGTTTGGGGSTGTGTNSSSGQTYVASGPLTLQSNTTVSGLVIDLGNAWTNGITGNGVSNVHITNCKIINTTEYSILLNNCSNITIDNCFFSNVAFGVNVGNSTTIKVNNNQFLNINGNNPKGMYGHAVQFNQVTGSGNQINGNHIENIANVAQNPHDQLSLYKSSGLPGDSIQVNNNWIRGGEYNNNSLGHGCGIGLGDNGGSYQVARGNILVNPGFIGMEAAGGNHVKIDHNLIYSSQTPVSGGGLFFANYSGVSSTDVTYSYNQVKWINSQGKELDYNSNGNSNGSSVILINNVLDANISASILPAVIITMK